MQNKEKKEQTCLFLSLLSFSSWLPCASMHLPSCRESKPCRDSSLWCFSCIEPCEWILFECGLCEVGPLVSKYLSLNTIFSTSCLFWLEFTVSKEKPCESGTQGEYCCLHSICVTVGQLGRYSLTVYHSGELESNNVNRKCILQVQRREHKAVRSKACARLVLNRSAHK